MALLISHRGNIHGMNPGRENDPVYVQEAIHQGYYVMVNVWLVGESSVALGTLRPTYPVDISFLRNRCIICEAMTEETLNFLISQQVHCFMTGQDRTKLTSGGLIWYRSNQKITPRTVMYMPEWYIPDIESLADFRCAGICSDRVGRIRIARRNVTNTVNTSENNNEDLNNLTIESDNQSVNDPSESNG